MGKRKGGGYPKPKVVRAATGRFAKRDTAKWRALNPVEPYKPTKPAKFDKRDSATWRYLVSKTKPEVAEIEPTRKPLVDKRKYDVAQTHAARAAEGKARKTSKNPNTPSIVKRVQVDKAVITRKLYKFKGPGSSVKAAKIVEKLSDDMRAMVSIGAEGSWIGSNTTTPLKLMVFLKNWQKSPSAGKVLGGLESFPNLANITVELETYSASIPGVSTARKPKSRRRNPKPDAPNVLGRANQPRKRKKAK